MRGLDPTRLIGQVLDARYRIEAHLGSGAMGAVFRARHVRLPRSFAIKVLHPRFVSEPKLVRRFEREARLAGKLSHPNVVAVLDFGESDGSSFMVMDLAVGPTLGRLITGAPFERARAIRLLRQLCDGLAHAHGHGLIHRDLKPENVIVEPQGSEELIRIVDFGIAILRDSAAGGAGEGRVTTSGLVLGTPHYMAPEVATGRAFDHRADLFALGVIAYEMLTGKMPFDGDGVAVVHANIECEPPAMAARAPQVTVDPALEAFARRLMARAPDARFPTARAAREVLDQLERGAPVPAAVPAPRPIGTRHLTPPDVHALGSAKTLAIGNLERPELDRPGDREPLVVTDDPSRPPRRPRSGR